MHAAAALLSRLVVPVVPFLLLLERLAGVFERTVEGGLIPLEGSLA